MSYNCSTRKLSSRMIGGQYTVPVAPVATVSTPDVDCLSGIYLPSSVQTGSWLLDHCQKTCCEPIACQPTCYQPTPYVSSPVQVTCSRQTTCVSNPCSTPCSRPLTFVSSGCQPLGGISTVCQPVKSVSTVCQPKMEAHEVCLPGAMGAFSHNRASQFSIKITRTEMPFFSFFFRQLIIFKIHGFHVFCLFPTNACKCLPKYYVHKFSKKMNVPNKQMWMLRKNGLSAADTICSCQNSRFYLFTTELCVRAGQLRGTASGQVDDHVAKEKKDMTAMSNVLNVYTLSSQKVMLFANVNYACSKLLLPFWALSSTICSVISVVTGADDFRETAIPINRVNRNYNFIVGISNALMEMLPGAQKGRGRVEAMLGDKLWRSLGANERFELLGNGEPMIAVEPANNKMVLDFVKTHLKNCKMVA
eukprot:bmy_11581T0